MVWYGGMNTTIPPYPYIKARNSFSVGCKSAFGRTKVFQWAVLSQKVFWWAVKVFWWAVKL
jgi:hypothetical protein